jgi:hypothetical protein
MDFSLHGHYHMRVFEAVLAIDATGPWNREAALAFDLRLRELVLNQLSEKSEWGMLARLHGQSVYTVDSTPILKELHRWRVENGLRHIAIVHSDDQPQIRQITDYQFNEIYTSDTGRLCESRFFQDHRDALKWLKSLGYHSRSDLPDESSASIQ